MNHRFPAFVFSLLLGFALAGIARADMRIVSMLELAGQSNVVFTGKVDAVGADSATIAVDEVLSGELQAGTSVSVSPITLLQCIGASPNFSVAERVLLFGTKAEGDRVKLNGDGQGKIPLPPSRETMEISAAKRLVALARLDEHAMNVAMLALVRSENDRLRGEARSHVTSKIAGSKSRDRYKDDLVALIGDPDAGLQITGLYGLQFIRAPEAVPRISELTRSDDSNVVPAASMALRPYDTPESVAALILLTRHTNPQIRIRACIDIRGSRRPEAKEALKQLLSDTDPKVRALAPVGFVEWLRREEAADALPRLVEMLDDEVPEVRARAADTLGESRNSGLVPPLIAALKNPAQDRNVKRSILNALGRHYSNGDSTARAAIDNDLEPIVTELKAGGPNDGNGPSFQAVGILGLSQKPEARNALEWAARSHPSKEIQVYARRSLSD